MPFWFFPNRQTAATVVTERDEITPRDEPEISPTSTLSGGLLCIRTKRLCDGRDGIITARSGVPNDFADVAPCLLASLAGGVRFHRQPDGTKWR
ncbi:hypothetical protein HALDL1_01000 (plasmid) [Halobacterium sp. DL1]|nr:hypothetical protein HALDL1_01000 [Halobacterium sp. DL1]